MRKDFDLYFAGSQNKISEEYLKTSGCHRLASQLIDRKIITDWIQSVKDGIATGKLFIDSGAYSAHTRNADLNVDEYINYLNDIDEYVQLFAQVDKIPGEYGHPKSRQDLMDAPRQSWENYLYMRERVKSPEKLIPIFHQDEEFVWLENLLEATFDGKHIPYIGISPANDKPVKTKIVFIERCFDIIAKSSNPSVKTHAFGMTSLNVLERYPFTSADSTSWIMNAANGSIMTKYGSVTLSSGRTHAPEHIGKMPRDAQEQIQDYVESHGYKLDELADDYKQRMNFNIMFLGEWASSYKYTSIKVKRKRLF